MAYDRSTFGFEGLDVHQKASVFRNGVYDLVRALPKEETYALGQQMRRAAVSVTNNMAEGYGRFNWQETMQFFRHARASVAELVDDLNVCRDQRYADQQLLDELRRQADDVLRLVNGYIRYLKNKKAEENS